MAKKQDKENQQFIVCVQYIRAPNAKDRLSRAINILLNSAPRKATQLKQTLTGTEEKPSGPISAGGVEDYNTNRSYDHER